MFGNRWERARDIFYDALTAQHLDHISYRHGWCAGCSGIPEPRGPQGVVSNKAGAFLRREVTHLGWARSFGPVIGAGDAAADMFSGSGAAASCALPTWAHTESVRLVYGRYDPRHAGGLRGSWRYGGADW